MSHSAENLRREYFTVALISGTEKIWIEGRGGVSSYSIQFFCLTVSKTSVGESLTVALIYGSEKVYGQEGGKGVSRFSLEMSLSHSAENLRRESFTVALFLGTEKVWIEWGEYHDNPSIFLSHSVENFRWGILYCCIISGSEKVYGQKDEKEYQDVPSKVFCLTVQKNSVGNPLQLH